MAIVFSAACPSCGGQVSIHSKTAVMAACPYCQSNLILGDQGLTLSGVHSAILEDFSAIQIGARGTIKNQSFAVIGRLQVQYQGGTWNEWYIQLSDGRTGWLSDSNGHYVYLESVEIPSNHRLPDFEDVSVGSVIRVTQASDIFYACDIRTAHILKSAVQGELPFIPKQNEVIRVVDARTTHQFLTLDYKADHIELFMGHAVDFTKLNWQNLRTEREMQESSGKIKGSTEESKCPNCGGTVQWLNGVAEHINCRYCGSELTIDDNIAKIIKAHNIRNLQAKRMALQIGQTANINGQTWTVIGMMSQTELDGDATELYVQNKMKKEFIPFTHDEWHEYLLFSFPDQFMWLVQSSDDDWAMAKTENTWPKLNTRLQPLTPSGRTLDKLYTYGGAVQYAVGAFYYQVSPQDTTFYADYGTEHNKISLEMTPDEMSFSSARKLSNATLESWFKASGGVQKLKLPKNTGTHSNRENIRNTLLAIFGVLNIPIFFSRPFQFFISIFIVMILLNAIDRDED